MGYFLVFGFCKPFLPSWCNLLITLVPVWMRSCVGGGHKKGDRVQRTNYRQMKEDPFLPFPSPLNFFLAPSSLCLSCTGWRRGDINSCQVEFLTHFKLPFWWSHPIRGSEEVTTISAKYVCVRYGVVSRINNWNYVRLCLSCANFLQNGCVAGFTKSQQIRH